jgi:hypothetical protein
MACFWFEWKEHGIGGIRRSHSWSFDLSFWSRKPSRIGLFSVDFTAPKEPCGGSIGSFEILATMPIYSIAIRSMKRPS